jgi:hypothetical protein
MRRAMTVDVTVTTVEPTPTAVVVAATTLNRGGSVGFARGGRARARGKD